MQGVGGAVSRDQELGCRGWGVQLRGVQLAETRSWDGRGGGVAVSRNQELGCRGGAVSRDQELGGGGGCS